MLNLPSKQKTVEKPAVIDTVVNQIKQQPKLENQLTEIKQKIDAIKQLIKDKDTVAAQIVTERSKYIQELNAAEIELKKKKLNLQPHLATLLNKCQVIEEEKQALRREMDQHLMEFEKMLRELGINP